MHAPSLQPRSQRAAVTVFPRFIRLSDACNRVAEVVLTLVSIAIGGVLSLQAFSRYVLNASLPWPEELAEVLLVWLTFIGASVAYRRSAHLTLDVFVSRLRHPLEDIAAAISLLGGFAFFAVATWYGAAFFWSVKAMSLPALGVSKGWSYVAIPLGCGFMMVHSLALMGSLNHWREAVHACLLPPPESMPEDEETDAGGTGA